MSSSVEDVSPVLCGLAFSITKQEFINSLLTTDVPALASFDPSGYFAIGYGNGSIPNGAYFQLKPELQRMPVLQMKGTAAAEADSTCMISYTTPVCGFVHVVGQLLSTAERQQID